jgi:hypothetical protein
VATISSAGLPKRAKEQRKRDEGSEVVRVGEGGARQNEEKVTERVILVMHTSLARSDM